MTPHPSAEGAPAHCADIDVSWCKTACGACLCVEILTITRRSSCEFRLSDDREDVDLRRADDTLFFLMTASRATLSVRGPDAARDLSDMHKLLRGGDERTLVARHCRA